jgi:uncharacterized membrane protein YgdD (TMEM256/DUF423 family)
MTSAPTIPAAARCWLSTGAALAALGVILGAFAAHGLDTHLVELYRDQPPKTIAGQEFAASYKSLQDFKTAAEYQLTHALGMIAVGLLSLRGPQRGLQVAGWAFLFGILLFSGSLYLLVLTQNTKLGMITPIGGTAMIVGWFALASSTFFSVRDQRNPTSDE